MKEIKEASKIAYDYFDKKAGVKGLCAIKDIGNAWVFDCGNPEVIYYGVNPIAINKDNGTIDIFMPSVENLERISSAEEVDIPKEYMYKAS